MQIEKSLSNAISKKYDTHAWNVALDAALEGGNVTQIRQVFDAVTMHLPTDQEFWQRYLEFEKSNGDNQRIEKIFASCLLVVFSIPLWTFYLSYIKESHSHPAVQVQDRAVISSAYEFALQTIGNDVDAGQIWVDYIQFVKEGFTTSTFEEQQKMEQLRKLYQKAVKIPLGNIENIWKDYDAFENQLNAVTAKKFIQDMAGPYMTARAALREMKGFFDSISSLQKNWVPKPVTWNDREVKLITAWKRYIVWETCNPMQLEDKTVIHGRVMYAYKCALAALKFFPEIWYDASQYLVNQGKIEDAVEIMKSSIEVNTSSLLLHFTLAEIMEVAKYDYSHVAKLFDSLIEKLEAHYAHTNAEFDKERDSLLQSLEAMAVPANETDEWDGERREEEREAQKLREKEVDSKIEVRRKRENRRQSQAITLAWIVYMRTSRRMQNMKTARGIFSRARKSPLCTYHIFVASAYMEFFCNKDVVVAGKVFEVGMRSMELGDEDAPHYVMHYLDFLTSMNDDNNTRALFERAVTGIPPARCREIWAKWLDYENQYGDIGNAARVALRVKEAYPEDISSGKNIDYLASRWKVFNLNIVGDSDLGLGQASLHARKIGPISAVARPLDEKVKRLASLEAVNPENYPRPDFSKYVLYKPEGALLDGTEEELPTFDFEVPEPITEFLKLLPTPKQYIGPRLPPDDVLTLLVQLPIPLPNVALSSDAVVPALPLAPPPILSAPMLPTPIVNVAPVPSDQTLATESTAKAPPPDPRLKRKAETGDVDAPNIKVKKEEK